jgi:tRNA(fMet)-specific endonuclease VapC
VEYGKLYQMMRYYCRTQILPFDDAAIAKFQELWIQRVRIGTMDLKIAAIALANDATLVTRNTVDFSKISNLRLADWSV